MKSKTTVFPNGDYGDELGSKKSRKALKIKAIRDIG